MFAEDLTALFDVTHGFAETVTVGGQSVAAIFDPDYIDVNGMESSGPVLTLPSNAARDANGVTVVARGVNYKVVEPMPDGTPAGVSMLRLQKT